MKRRSTTTNLLELTLFVIIRFKKHKKQKGATWAATFTLSINYLFSVITHSRVLRYADDVKLCLSNLQCDLNNFQITDKLLDLTRLSSREFVPNDTRQRPSFGWAGGVAVGYRAKKRYVIEDIGFLKGL